MVSGTASPPDRGGCQGEPEPVPVRPGTSTYRGQGAPWSADNRTEGGLRGRAGAPRDRPRNLAEKVVDVCRHNGLFLAIATVSETWDGIRHAVRRSREPHPFHGLGVAVVTQNGGIGRRDAVPRRSVLAPVPAGPGRALARALSGPVHARVRPSRYDGQLRAPRRSGRLGGECAAMAYTPLEHSPCATVGPGRRAVHARVHPPAPRGSGGRSHGIHIPTGEGCAGRFAAGRGVGRPAASRTAPGSGCPLRPRGAG